MASGDFWHHARFAAGHWGFVRIPVWYEKGAFNRECTSDKISECISDTTPSYHSNTNSYSNASSESRPAFACNTRWKPPLWDSAARISMRYNPWFLVQDSECPYHMRYFCDRVS